MRNRALRSALLVLGTVAVGFMGSAGTALAGEDSGDPGGYVEICKTFNAPASSADPGFTGSFTFEVVDSQGNDYWKTLTAHTGDPQVCTTPFAVAAGRATVQEEYNGEYPWFSIDSIKGVGAQPAPYDVDLDPTSSGYGSAYIDVPPALGDNAQAFAAVAAFTDDPVYGVTEVCKAAGASDPTVSGTFPFTITSADDIGVQQSEEDLVALDGPGGWLDPTGSQDVTTDGSTAWSTTTTATIDSGSGTGCSEPIIVPAGPIETQENGVTFVDPQKGITATSNGVDEILDPWTYPAEYGPDLADATSYEMVNPGDTTNQTIVTYTDDISTVKLCKAWDSESGPVPASQFGFTATSDAPAGTASGELPTTVPGNISVPTNDCVILANVVAGTQVNIAENSPTSAVDPAPAGTKVESITASDSNLIVPGSLSLPYGTVSVIAGPGETDVYYTDEAADPSTLKVCVNPTSTVTAASIPFSITDGGSTHTLNVPLSNTSETCALDTDYSYAYGSKVGITGSIPSGAGSDAFTGTASVLPADLEVYDSMGSPFVTDIPSVIGTASASSLSYEASEGITTEVTFEIDPPAPVTAPPVTVSAPAPTTGGTTNLGAPTPPVITPTSGGGGSTPVTPSTTSNAITNDSSVNTTTPSGPIGTSARVRKLEKQSASTKSQIKKLERKLKNKHLKRSLRKADRRKLASLRKLEAKLIRELKI